MIKLIGTGYLLYLAWLIAKTPTEALQREKARPLTFLQAALFQWVNPKAWVMALTAASVFLSADETHWTDVAALCAVFIAVNIPCIFTWVTIGASARRLFGDARWRRAFGALIVLLMAYTIIAIWV